MERNSHIYNYYTSGQVKMLQANMTKGDF